MIKNQAYREIYGHLIELGIRLQCKSETICTAIIYFYRLSEKTDCTKIYDKFNVARACFCAASTREGDTQYTGAEDVLNVSNKILSPESHPVLIVDERAAGRMKEFDEVRRILNKPGWQFTGAPKAHQHLARYLSLLRDYQPRLFEQYEMEKLCTIVLQDMYICPYFIWSSTGEIVAALAIHFALKFVAPEIKTDDYVRNVCPQISRSHMKKLRRFVWDKVYML
uniref:Uncharacterized protein n=1 Tax=Panagrolaimus superbus TaxID=310955 RepID=A0A914ZDD7_9BILA